jgi:hypothetical protein
MGYEVCDGGPEELAAALLCLDEVSKDLKGELDLLDAEERVCERWDCKTLVVQHLLRIEVMSHRCDSALGAALDGMLLSRDLTTVYADGSGLRRGLHAGSFLWRTGIGILQGRLRGLTNEGTHREPAFRACQECDQVGVMEGRLCGRLVRAKDPELVGLQVSAAYRISFDASEQGGRGGVAGTIEGVLVRSCDPRTDCGC